MSEEESSTYTRRRRIKKSSGVASPELVGSASGSEKDRKDDHQDRTSSGMQQRFVDVLGWGIFSLWAIGFSIDMLDLKKGWDLPPGIWGLMTILSGGAFVAQALKKETRE